MRCYYPRDTFLNFSVLNKSDKLGCDSRVITYKELPGDAVSTLRRVEEYKFYTMIGSFMDAENTFNHDINYFL